MLCPDCQVLNLVRVSVVDGILTEKDRWPFYNLFLDINIAILTNNIINSLSIRVLLLHIT